MSETRYAPPIPPDAVIVEDVSAQWDALVERTVEEVKEKEQGTVYLIHFDPPYAHAQHYLGWTRALSTRFRRHFNGHGSRLVRAAIAAGCRVRIVRVWEGKTRDDERRMHKGKNNPQLCPECAKERRARAKRATRATRAKAEGWLRMQEGE